MRSGESCAVAAVAAVLAAAAFGCDGDAGPPGPTPHVILIDVDDHGLLGLDMANAPHLKGLIARGTLAYTRVIVPTHSNQSNIALLTGQYPDGNNVPANSWLSRDRSFGAPLDLAGVSVGDYARYDRNPLLTRGESVYGAIRRAGLRSAYFGELPPFEAGADEVHLSIVGMSFGSVTITREVARGILSGLLLYPKAVLDGYHFDGPPATGESLTRFTLRNAADFIRGTSAQRPMPDFMFIWDFLALDNDPTGQGGAAGPGLVALVEEYDAGVGDLLAALDEKELTADTNIVFTLDHGKVDTHNQVVLGTRGATDGMPADGQLGALIAARGASVGITTGDYALLNEDGDAQIYARVPGAGTDAGAVRQAEVTQALVTLIQSGEIMGLDTTRTMTADGVSGTRRFRDYHGSSPNQADIVVFPQDDWTLNQVDPTNAQPGPFREHTGAPFGRHGGFSIDELYVPLIMAGPAFKVGALVPHPVEHPQVPATALAALGDVRLLHAAVPAISAALAGNPAETLDGRGSLAEARDIVLRRGGYTEGPSLGEKTPQAVVIIDVAGVYDDELFGDDQLAAEAEPLRALAARGTRFADFWTRSRDWPVTELEMLAGAGPFLGWYSEAEADPAQRVAPGVGLLMMPPPAGFIADRAGYDIWREDGVLAAGTLLDSARAMGLGTAIVGTPDFHRLHIPPDSFEMGVSAAGDAAAGAVRDLLAASPRLLVLVVLGAARTGDRHAPAARAELAALSRQAAAVADAAPGALVVLTSRGATAIDDPDADVYGAGSSRHVPFVIVGPSVRQGVVTSQPAQPADLRDTVLFALGAPTRTDFVDGSWTVGPPVATLPTPRGALTGHVLSCAFVATAR